MRTKYPNEKATNNTCNIHDPAKGINDDVISLVSSYMVTSVNRA